MADEISVPLTLRARKWTGDNYEEIRGWVNRVFPDVQVEQIGPDLFVRTNRGIARRFSEDRPLATGGHVILSPIGVFTLREGALERFMS